MTIVRCGYHDGKYNDAPHLHQFSELIWVFAGELEMTVDGDTVTATAGQVILVPPFSVHSFRTPEYCRIWICVYSNDFALGFLGNEDLYARWSTPVHTLSDGLVGYLESIRFIDTCLAFDWTDSCCRVVRAAIGAVFEEYLRSVTRVEKTGRENALSRTLIYIGMHYREPITLASVCEAIGYTPCYVSHCFDALGGMNFRTLVNTLRIEYSKILLVTTSFKLIDVALESGFSGERSFFRAFSRIVGMTPGEYRRNGMKGRTA